MTITVRSSTQTIRVNPVSQTVSVVLSGPQGPAGEGGGGGDVASVNGATGVVVLDADDIDDAATTNKFATAAQLAKVDHLAVTQAVDLDAIETRVNSLDAAVVLRGSWDASSGSFPGGGTAQAGDSYIVSVGGTVDSQVFVANDRIVAIVDNASTATYAANWLKLDYTDQVLSVAGLTGAITDSALRTALALVIGTNVQAYDGDLASIAALTTAAFGRSVLTAADKAALQALVGISYGTADPSGGADGDIYIKYVVP